MRGKTVRNPVAAWRGFIGAQLTCRRHRDQYAHLETLPDYLLRDVGLTREDVRLARRLAARPDHGE